MTTEHTQKMGLRPIWIEPRTQQQARLVPILGAREAAACRGRILSLQMGLFAGKPNWRVLGSIVVR